MAVIEIEVDSPTNRNYLFGPAGEVVRGRLDFNRMKQREAFELCQEFAAGIPGQRIGWDDDRGEGYIAEPLHDPEHAGTRAALERKKLGVTAPARRALTGHGAHRPTMLYWMGRAVAAGLAKVVRGRLPESIEGEPVKDFIRPKAAPPASEGMLKQMLALMYAKLPAGERKAFEEFMTAANSK